MMKTTQPISPTLDGLQAHLMGIQTILYQREEANRKHELSLREAELSESRYKQQAQQRKAEAEHINKNLEKAIHKISQFKAQYRDVIIYFQNTLQVIIGENMSPEAIIEASERIEPLEPYVDKVAVFLEKMAKIGYEKSLTARFLKIDKLNDFYSAASGVSSIFDRVPTEGMGGCIALDERGKIVAPWELEKAMAFQQRSNGIIFSFVSTEPVSYDEAVAQVEKMNSYKICNKQNWKIPGIDEINFIDLNRLAQSGVNVPRKFWTKQANNSGRFIAYVRKNNSRIITGARDNFSTIFISN